MKIIFRPGVYPYGSWGPMVPVYPRREEHRKIGDKVWVIVLDNEANVLIIEEDEIAYIGDDYADHLVMLQNPDIFTEMSKHPIGPKENYALEFWIKKYNPGWALFFGETLYDSLEEAEGVLKQYPDFDEVDAEKVMETVPS